MNIQKIALLALLSTTFFIISACGGGGGGGSAVTPPAASYLVTPSAGANGSISPSGVQTITTGNTATFVVTSLPGFTPSVTGCGGTLNGNIYTTAAITGACTVAATFSPQQLKVTPSVGSHGSISPSTVQNVTYNNTTSFTVTPDTGFNIVAVSGCGVGTLAGNTYTTGLITGDCTVSASFVATEYPITSQVTSGSGTIACSPSPAQNGSTVNCTITPASGYQFSSLLDNGTNVTGSVSGTAYSITNVTGAHALNAAFALKQYTVTPSAGSNGSLTPGTPQTISQGGTPAFTVTPDPGYFTTSVTGCGGTLSGSTYTTSPVVGNCTVSASFAHYTSGTLTLSILSEPFLLRFLELDIPLPSGVQPANRTPGANPDIFDVSGSITPLPFASTFTVSTNTLKIIIFNSSGQGTGNFSLVNLAVATNAPVTSSSFPANATVLTATDMNLDPVPNPAVIQVTVTATLQ